MDERVVLIADSLLDNLEEVVNELDTQCKNLVEYYGQMLETEGLMINSLLRNPTDKKLLQIERMQMLRKRVRAMLPYASSL